MQVRYIGFISLIALLMLGLLLLRSKSAFFAYHLNKNGVHIIRDVIYVAGSENPKHRLDLYLPEDKTNYPLIYFVHGGNWNSGDKYYYQWITGLYGNIGVVLAKRGVGVAIANYRLYPETTIEGMLDDVVMGTNYAVQNANRYGWNKKIYLMGHSAGGHLITLAMTNHTLKTSATINKQDIVGIIPLSPILDIPMLTSKSEEDYNERVVYPLFGKTLEEQKPYSSITHWKSITVPVCALVGEYDYSHIRDLGVKFANATVLPKYYHSDLVTRIGSSNDLVIPTILNCLNLEG